MANSAVEKTPVEIWVTILGHAMQTSLFPHPDSTFAQSIAIFSITCDCDGMNRQLVQISTKLRLVCRSWDNVVKRIQPEVLHYNFDLIHADLIPPHILHFSGDFPSAESEEKNLGVQRIQAWMPFGCICGLNCRSSIAAPQLHDLFDKEKGLWSFKCEPVVPKQALSRVEVYIRSRFDSEDDPIPLLDSMPNLKVLGCGYPRADSLSAAILLHPSHSQLTHLHMATTVEIVSQMKTPVHFRALEFLLLSIRPPKVPSYIKEGGPTLATWAIFPVLRGLSLLAFVQPPQVKELVTFLSVVGPGLTGLMLTIQTEEDPYNAWFEPKMWEFFPNLVNFGPGISALTSVIPSPPESLSLTIVIAVSDDPADAGLPVDGPTLLDIFIDTCQGWNTREVVLMYTWDRMEGHVGNMIEQDPHDNRLLKQTAFYDALVQTGVNVRDGDGVLITERPGQRFMYVLSQLEAHFVNAAPNDLGVYAGAPLEVAV